MMGFVTLAGISTRNGILKISRYINLVVHEGEAFGPDLVMRGSLERLAPVLLTALSAGLALTPLLFGAGEPGREILHPVAVTIFGGLVSSTLLDAVLTPTLFLAFGRRPLERAFRMRARTRLRRPKSTDRRRDSRCGSVLSIALLVAHGTCVRRRGAERQTKGANGGEVVVMEGHPIEFVSQGTGDRVLHPGGRRQERRRRPRDSAAAP